MKTPVALATLREAVRLGSVATFLYEGLQMEAELHLLGQARKTKAYIVLALVSQSLRPVKGGASSNTGRRLWTPLGTPVIGDGKRLSLIHI